MRTKSTQFARDVAPDARRYMESVLGGPIADDARITIEVNAAAKVVHAPTPEEKAAAARRIRELFLRWEALPEPAASELDDAIDEAVAAVRATKRR